MTTDLYGRLIGAIEDIRIELEFHNGDLPPDVYSRLHKSNRALKVAMEMCKEEEAIGYDSYEQISFEAENVFKRELLARIVKEIGVTG